MSISNLQSFAISFQKTIYQYDTKKEEEGVAKGYPLFCFFQATTCLSIVGLFSCKKSLAGLLGENFKKIVFLLVLLVLFYQKTTALPLSE